MNRVIHTVIGFAIGVILVAEGLIIALSSVIDYTASATFSED